MEKTDHIREMIAKVSDAPLERHGEMFSEINDQLAAQLQEIESA